MANEEMFIGDYPFKRKIKKRRIKKQKRRDELRDISNAKFKETESKKQKQGDLFFNKINPGG